MVLLNNVDDALIQPMLEREIYTFLYMRDDDQRTHCRRKIVMRISLEAHVLGKVFRLHQLTDIVKVRTDAADRPICTDRFGGSFGQISYDKAMVIGARRFDGHAPQQGVI